MGLIRLLIIFLLAYFFIRLLKRLFLPKTQRKDRVQGETRNKKSSKQYKDIEDADYEELE